ncbi:uncharacterized protein DNG_05936 [Cephalotrichum gorgonifer]|uniref:Uncharacterized protein n=1 Tax=Cephalotrichum gorgonifer TaxID=2041049 RepID=A0AAE8SW57_9PEZI|nr:uncharacterized protein DNG_05936 [Cephalotrichum gorgonifer]
MSRSRASRRKSKKDARKQEATDYQAKQQQTQEQNIRGRFAAENQAREQGREEVEDQQSGLPTHPKLVKPTEKKSLVEKQQAKKRQAKKNPGHSEADLVSLLHDREALSFPGILRPAAARDPTTHPEPVSDERQALIEDTYAKLLAAPRYPYVCDAWIYSYRGKLAEVRYEEVEAVLGDMSARWFREALRGFEKDPEDLGGDVYQWPACPDCGCYKDKPRKRVGKAHATRRKTALAGGDGANEDREEERGGASGTTQE